MYIKFFYKVQFIYVVLLICGISSRNLLERLQWMC